MSKPLSLDPETLRELYWEDDLSIAEVADELDCGHSTVQRWMDEFDIPRRDQRQATVEANRVERASFYTEDYNYGWELWCSHNGPADKDKVAVHQLLACLDHDPHEVFAPDTVVHHRNGIPWDNRRENLDLMTPSEHMRLHSRHRWNGGELVSSI